MLLKESFWVCPHQRLSLAGRIHRMIPATLWILWWWTSVMLNLFLRNIKIYSYFQSLLNFEMAKIVENLTLWKTRAHLFYTGNTMAAGDQGPIPETIRSRSAQIRSCDPDQPIAFHKRRSRSAHQIEKLRNQTVYCQLNHDKNHSLGNLELKLRGLDLIKKVRLMISIHDVTMGGVATSFMSADTRAPWPVQCTRTVFAHDTTRFGHAIFDRYVYVIGSFLESGPGHQQPWYRPNLLRIFHFQHRNLC